MKPEPQTRAVPTTLSKAAAGLFGTVLEQFLFHPVDTAAKRAMAHKPLSMTGLYKGLGPALLRKGPTRTYKWTFQDVAATWLTNNHQDSFQPYCGQYTKIAIEATAGVATGVFEPFLFQWIDALQVIKQTDGAKGKTYLQIAQERGVRGLYRGTLITGFGRNAPGCLGMFGGTAWADYTLGNANREDRGKNFQAKLFGSFLSLVLSQPTDVIKTNMQTQNLPFWMTVQQLSIKQMCTSGLPARLVTSGKLGFGFFLVGEIKKVTTEHLGDRVPIEEQEIASICTA